jgi:hypothetical protein
VTVGHPFGVVEGEDLVAPFEEGVEEGFELGERPGVVGVEEVAEGLVGLVVVVGEVDTGSGIIGTEIAPWPSMAPNLAPG